MSASMNVRRALDVWREDPFDLEIGEELEAALSILEGL